MRPRVFDKTEGVVPTLIPIPLFIPSWQRKFLNYNFWCFERRNLDFGLRNWHLNAVFLNSIVSNLVSAGIRLIPLGQIAGQKSIISLEEVIIKATSKAMKRDIEDFGSAALVVDWTSMKHETQYTRLFRS